jgi:hypothetical protein
MDVDDVVDVEATICTFLHIENSDEILVVFDGAHSATKMLLDSSAARHLTDRPIFLDERHGKDSGVRNLLEKLLNNLRIERLVHVSYPPIHS